MTTRSMTHAEELADGRHACVPSCFVEAPVEAPVREKTPADVLRHAALVIEEVGWSDDEPLTDEGCRCAGGAMAFVVNGSMWDSEDPLVVEAAQWLLRSLGRDSYTPLGGVAGWNDDEAGSAEVVTAALRAAADRWDAEHPR